MTTPEPRDDERPAQGPEDAAPPDPAAPDASAVPPSPAPGPGWGRRADDDEVEDADGPDAETLRAALDELEASAPDDDDDDELGEDDAWGHDGEDDDRPGWSPVPEGEEPRYDDAERGPRLQKVMAEAGVGSKRHCEELIAAGEVQVNGAVVTRLPSFVDPDRDRIVVSGEGIRTRTKPVYVMLYKPRGVLSTNEENADRRTAVEMVRHPSKARLFPVGRLDADSTGLLLLTNDGELANRLTHPRYGVHKTYEVTVKGSLDAAAVQKLERGIFLPERTPRGGGRPGPGGTPSGRRTQRSSLALLHRGRTTTRLLMRLREGRNRQIRRMMLYVGVKVHRLKRVQLGPLRLSELSPGQWRDLTPGELKSLKTVAEAGAERARRAEGRRGGPPRGRGGGGGRFGGGRGGGRPPRRDDRGGPPRGRPPRDGGEGGGGDRPRRSGGPGGGRGGQGGRGDWSGGGGGGRPDRPRGGNRGGHGGGPRPRPRRDDGGGGPRR